MHLSWNSRNHKNVVNFMQNHFTSSQIIALHFLLHHKKSLGSVTNPVRADAAAV